MRRPPPAADREMESGRAEAFSDGVFAIAITLLILSLRLPGPRPGCTTLTCQLLQAWPQYFAYVVSFLTIGIMWMNHHTIFGHVTRVDRPLLVLNLLLLMGVVAIPFPTALVAEHLRDSGGTAATVTYGLVMIAISAGFAGIWVYVVTHTAALGAAVPEGALRQSVPGFVLGGAVYVGGTLIAAFLSAIAGLVIFGLLGVYYLFEHLPDPTNGAGVAGTTGTAGPGQPGGPPR
ncbi:MAG TPA: TMEM175 family protein [Streptosporangiaceae bacterium]